MLRNFLVPVLIVIGALLVFSVLLKETDAPKGTFDLTNANLNWLLDRSDLTILLEENGPRDVPGGVNACYASRTVDFKRAGTATIEQTCTDEEQRQFTDSGRATWSVDGETLCMDMRPLDRDPGCWEITYRDGTFEFKNEAKTIRWFGRVFSSDTETLEQLVNGMKQN